MADKFRRTEPVNLGFSNGEQPTAAKLRAIIVQSRAGSQVLERAIGDLWNQSGDPYLFNYPLQINNIGRTIGQIRYINPTMYRTSQSFTYIDSIGSLNTGRTDGYTTFKPSSGVTIAAGSTAITTLQAAEALVVLAGDIWVDTATGRFKSFSPLTSNDKLEYVVDSSEWSAGFEQVPSIIPDPRQATFSGCRVSGSGPYLLHLPPRRQLTLSGHERPERYPASIDYLANEASTTSLPRRLWQYSTAALADEHYRYGLSKEIRDVLGAINVGEILPQGLIQLYDQASQTIIEDCVFKKTSTAWVFEISSNSVNFSGKVTANENQASYNSTGYSVITSGTSISRAIAGLTKAVQGKHNSSGNFSSVMDHSDLRYPNPSSTNANYPAGYTNWAPSRWGSGDEHTSLLSRAGSWGTAGTKNRDVNDNAMLGDFLMASSTLSGGNYLNITASSRRIYFGSTVNGPNMYFNSTSNAIILTGASNSGTSTAVYAQSNTSGTSGWALRALGNGSNGVSIIAESPTGGGAGSRAIQATNNIASGIAIQANGGSGASAAAIRASSQLGGTGILVSQPFDGTGIKVTYSPGAVGVGLICEGGPSGGDAAQFAAKGNNGNGITVTAFNQGTGIIVSGDATNLNGIGTDAIVATGGTQQGAGIRATGGVNAGATLGAPGGVFTGGPGSSTNYAGSSGVIATGTSYSYGVLATGGPNGGNGGRYGAGGDFTAGGGDSNGINVTGTGNGHGILVTTTGTGSSGNGIDVTATGSGVGVRASSNTGFGGQFSSSSTYGLVVVGPGGGTPVKAAFRIVPQSAQPTGAHLIGDMYVTTGGVLKICTAAGTPGTWVSVGAQT